MFYLLDQFERAMRHHGAGLFLAAAFVVVCAVSLYGWVRIERREE